MIKYEWRFVQVCKLMNGELSGPANLWTENCPPVQISRPEKCLDEDLLGPCVNYIYIGKVNISKTQHIVCRLLKQMIVKSNVYLFIYKKEGTVLIYQSLFLILLF